MKPRPPVLGMGGPQKPNASRAWSPLDSDNLRLMLTTASFRHGDGWLDQSGFDNDFVGSTGSLGTIDSRQCVTFDGTDFLEGCQLSDLMDSSGRWYCAGIFYADQDGTSPTGTGILCADAGANAVPSGLVFDGWPNGTTDRYNNVVHTLADGNGWSGIAAGSDAKQVWCFVEWGNDGSSVKIRTRSTSSQISAGSGTAGIPWTTSIQMLLAGGTEVGATRYFTGGIQALMCFRGAPQSADMAGVRSFVATQYGFADPGSNLF